MNHGDQLARAADVAYDDFAGVLAGIRIGEAGLLRDEGHGLGCTNAGWTKRQSGIAIQSTWDVNRKDGRTAAAYHHDELVLILSRRPDFQIVWIWYLSVASVVFQLAMSMWLLFREFRKKLTFAA